MGRGPEYSGTVLSVRGRVWAWNRVRIRVRVRPEAQEGPHVHPQLDELRHPARDPLLGRLAQG